MATIEFRARIFLLTLAMAGISACTHGAQVEQPDSSAPIAGDFWSQFVPLLRPQTGVINAESLAKRFHVTFGPTDGLHGLASRNDGILLGFRTEDSLSGTSVRRVNLTVDMIEEYYSKHCTLRDDAIADVKKAGWSQYKKMPLSSSLRSVTPVPRDGRPPPPPDHGVDIQIENTESFMRDNDHLSIVFSKPAERSCVGSIDLTIGLPGLH